MGILDIYAHSSEGSQSEWQLLNDHLDQVAELAATKAEAFNAHSFARWAGLLHDFGKASDEFQKYIRGGNGRVDHSTAGAQIARKLWQEKAHPQSNASLVEIMSRIVAYTIAGHHGGLPDDEGLQCEAGSLTQRLAKKDVPDCSGFRDLLTLPENVPDRLPFFPLSHDHASFSLAFFTRMLFSSLTDADFLDTEHFCAPEKHASRGIWPGLDSLAPLLADKISSFEKIAGTPSDTPVKAARREILGHCRKAADNNQGFFSLTVPTGGGKTISSLAFALDHARRNGLRRIIFVIPYTSIIEQNAQVFRDILGDNAVLEHHSSYAYPDEDSRGFPVSENAETVTRFRLAAENWEATLVVTTAVQFFESLFACRSSRCRKLHNIARSAVILDEAQMLPLPLLQPSVMALRELVKNYGCSVVLCTATQPALTRSERLAEGIPTEELYEIIPEDRIEPLFSVFQRSRVEDIGDCDDSEIASRLAQERQVLCIVNTRRHAAELFNALGQSEGHFHLSARMYPAHRKRILAKIRQRLGRGEICRVVSTSLIECGVDVDFPAVFRAAAGLDSVAQAAGRCNREGLLDTGRVYVFRPETGMPRNPSFRRRAEAFRAVAPRHDDIFSREAVREYFTCLYQFEELDAKGIMESVRESTQSLWRENKFFYPFRTQAEEYRFIENDMLPVIVERDKEACELVSVLEHGDYTSGILRKLQAHTVQVYPNELKKLLNGGVVLIRDQFYVARGGAGYQEHVGLCVDDPTYLAPENAIF